MAETVEVDNKAATRDIARNGRWGDGVFQLSGHPNSVLEAVYVDDHCVLRVAPLGEIITN